MSKIKNAAMVMVVFLVGSLLLMTCAKPAPTPTPSPTATPVPQQVAKPTPATVTPAPPTPTPVPVTQRWKAYTYISSVTHRAFLGVKKIAEEADKRTGGTLKIEPFVGGELPIGATDINRATAEGATVQLASDGFFTGAIPVGGILYLPMLFQNETEYHKGVEIFRPYLEKELDKLGIKYLGYYVYPTQKIFAVTPVTKLDDIKGMKVRVTNAEQAEIIKRLGGSPVTLGTPDVAPALERKVIHAVMTAASGYGIIGKDFWTHLYPIGINFHFSMYIANKAAFEKLPKNAQDILVDLAKSVGPEVTNGMRDDEDKITSDFKSKGVVVTPATSQDVARATEAIAPFWDEWAKGKGATAVEALAKVRQAIGR